MSKITPDLLINSGYRQHKPGLGHEHAEALYQKAFSDDLGIKYYLNIYHYSHKIGTEVFEGFQPEAQFKWAEGDNRFNVTLMIDAKTAIADVEVFFEAQFDLMDCRYYKVFSEV